MLARLLARCYPHFQECHNLLEDCDMLRATRANNDGFATRMVVKGSIGKVCNQAMSSGKPTKDTEMSEPWHYNSTIGTFMFGQ